MKKHGVIALLAFQVAACDGGGTPARDGGLAAVEDSRVVRPQDARAADVDAGTITSDAGRDSGASASGAVPRIGSCNIYPADNAWNRDISGDPVDSKSDAIIANIQANGDDNLHLDWSNTNEYGIPFNVVPESQPLVPIRFTEYGDESDPGPYPIPNSPLMEAGSGNDRHVLVLQEGTCRLFELYHAVREGKGWAAGSGAVFDLASNALRPYGWTSADQGGLPITVGLVRYDEIRAGQILHALRVTFDHTQNGWLEPATHPGGDDDPDAPVMGLRLRLRADYPTTGMSTQSRVLAEAMKRYGLIVADTGGNWFITGASDPGYEMDALIDDLQSISGNDFEVVRMGEVHRW